MQHVPTAPYLIVAPAGPPIPVVLSSPHSGRHYPDSLVAQLRVPVAQLRGLDDGPIDDLMASGCAMGATLLAATYPRAVVDLNRDACELDPDSLVDPAAMPGLRLTAKARAGLGIVPTQLLGAPIYRQRLTAADLQHRLCCIYRPYHAQLQVLLRERRQSFAKVLLLDCHSMPTLQPSARGEKPIDVALGDRFGRSCASGLTRLAEQLLGSAGLKVARNRPYAGGYITEHYGQPGSGVHALQLEVRRGLFMHETTHEPHDGFRLLQTLLGELVRVLADSLLDPTTAFGDRRPSSPASAALALTSA